MTTLERVRMQMSEIAGEARRLGYAGNDNYPHAERTWYDDLLRALSLIDEAIRLERLEGATQSSHDHRD